MAARQERGLKLKENGVNLCTDASQVLNDRARKGQTEPLFERRRQQPRRFLLGQFREQRPDQPEDKVAENVTFFSLRQLIGRRRTTWALALIKYRQKITKI